MTLLRRNPTMISRRPPAIRRRTLNPRPKHHVAEVVVGDDAVIEKRNRAQNGNGETMGIVNENLDAADTRLRVVRVKAAAAATARATRKKERRSAPANLLSIRRTRQMPQMS